MKAVALLVLLFGIILMTAPAAVRSDEVSDAVEAESESEDAVFAELEAADEAADEAEDAAESEHEEESEDEVESADEAEESEEEEGEAEADTETEEASFAEVQGAGDACLAGWNSAKANALGAAAAKMQASYKAQGIKYSQAQRSFGPRPSTKKSDCSGFVTSVLDSVGANCLFSSGRNTASMKPLMNARGGYHQVPLKGDIVMWGGHTGIITNKVCPKNTAELVAMGNSGCSATGCITVAAMKKWGSGGWLGFWTPKSK